MSEIYDPSKEELMDFERELTELFLKYRKFVVYGPAVLFFTIRERAMDLAKKKCEEEKRDRDVPFSEEELMWIYNALCDYDKNHSRNLNEKSIESLRNLTRRIWNMREKRR